MPASGGAGFRTTRSPTPSSTGEEGQLDDERTADDLAAEALDEARDRLDSPTRREHVVVDEHARARSDHLRVHFERVLPVFERVGRAHGLRRQLARTARGDE